jgi:hypothetical protein
MTRKDFEFFFKYLWSYLYSKTTLRSKGNQCGTPPADTPIAEALKVTLLLTRNIQGHLFPDHVGKIPFLTP